MTSRATHEVFNQPPPFADGDLFAGDAALAGAAAAFAAGGGANSASLSAFGRRWGSAEMLEHGRLANEHPPTLKSFDAAGRRRDEVEFHLSYHREQRRAKRCKPSPRQRPLKHAPCRCAGTNATRCAIRRQAT